jgi:hypothetical protein
VSVARSSSRSRCTRTRSRRVRDLGRRRGDAAQRRARTGKRCSARCTAGLSALLAAKLFSARAGIVAGLRVALHRPAIWFPTLLLKENLFLPLPVSRIALALATRESGRQWLASARSRRSGALSARQHARAAAAVSSRGRSRSTLRAPRGSRARSRGRRRRRRARARARAGRCAQSSRRRSTRADDQRRRHELLRRATTPTIRTASRPSSTGCAASPSTRPTTGATRRAGARARSSTRRETSSFWLHADARLDARAPGRPRADPVEQAAPRARQPTKCPTTTSSSGTRATCRSCARAAGIRVQRNPRARGALFAFVACSPCAARSSLERASARRAALRGRVPRDDRVDGRPASASASCSCRCLLPVRGLMCSTRCSHCRRGDWSARAVVRARGVAVLVPVLAAEIRERRFRRARLQPRGLPCSREAT